ncbi:Putative pentatricopeptide repeat-containing protein At1g19290 [Linum perenne]
MMINGYCKSQSLGEAKQLLNDIDMNKKEIPPDTTTYNTLVGGFCRQGRLKDAQAQSGSAS